MIRKYWTELPSEKQLLVRKLSVTAAAVLVAWLAWILKSASSPVPADDADEQIEIVSDDRLFEDDFREEARQQQQEVGSILDEQRRDIAALREIIETMQTRSGNPDVPPGTGPDSGTGAADAVTTWPQPPLYIKDRDEAADPVPDIAAPPVVIGAIRHVKGVENHDNHEKKTAVADRFYLSPGFMKARLLEGVEVAATQNAEDNPPALLFRVQKPAVLPNNVKADLKGCFVIANAYGKLNKERIDFRTVSLHCISHKDRTLIDTEIRGHVDDRDGKMGLAARVVTRVGANIGRAFASGMISGLGEGYSNSISNGISTTGGTVVSEPLSDGQIVKTGIGSGLSRGARILEEFYLDIIRQTTPTLESGSGRDVTIVLTEGVWLEIRAMDAAEGDRS